ncbi:MAG: phosphoribosyltransferase family protein [Candidatus Saccharimonadales bacterium]
MRLIERFISIYAPHICLGCEHETDALLCPSCTVALPNVASRCYKCHAATRDFAVCETCKPSTPLRHVYVAYSYSGLAKELLHRAKYERAKSGLAEMASVMAPLLQHVAVGTVLVPVPTATKRARQRGYDQAEVLAGHIARQTNFRRMNLLARLGQAHQVGSNRTARFEHIKGVFRVTRPASAKGRTIILVDDVLTTGATLEEAAAMLKKAHAKRVDAIVFAQAG